MIDTPNKNNLSNDVVIKGSIKFANEFIFDGNLEGDITSADGILDRVDELVGESAHSSLYPTLALKASSEEVLRILPGIGGVLTTFRFDLPHPD